MLTRKARNLMLEAAAVGVAAGLSAFYTVDKLVEQANQPPAVAPNPVPPEPEQVLPPKPKKMVFNEYYHCFYCRKYYKGRPPHYHAEAPQCERCYEEQYGDTPMLFGDFVGGME